MCDPSSTCGASSASSRHPSQTNGWVDGDAYHTFSGSMRSTSWAHAERAGPTFAPGSIYEMRYVQPFTFSRQSKSLCVGVNDKLDYCWGGVCPEETARNAQYNYMFVIGHVNGTDRSKLLVLFYNGPCQGGEERSTTWLPAIYDHGTGTLASEIGQCQVQGNAQNACWSIFTQTTTTTGHYTARASLLCDCNRMQSAIQWLSYILRALVRNQPIEFPAFVDLSAVMYALPIPTDIVTRPSCCPSSGTETMDSAPGERADGRWWVKNKNSDCEPPAL